MPRCDFKPYGETRCEAHATQIGRHPDGKLCALACDRHVEILASDWPDVSWSALVTFPLALSLLAYWERPWSSRAMRFALFALARAARRGIDVLEGAPASALDTRTYATWKFRSDH